MRSLTTVILTVLCMLLPGSVASAAPSAPRCRPTLPAPMVDHRAPAALGGSARFCFVPLGIRFAATGEGRAKTGAATLSGIVTSSAGEAVPGATLEWFAPMDGVWQHGSTSSGSDGSYSLTGIPAADGTGELWCTWPTVDALIGRTAVSWPDASTTTFDFVPETFYARLTDGGPWSDWKWVTIWLYGADGRSALVSATTRGRYDPYATLSLPGHYDKAAVYWWTNEGLELDVNLRRVKTDGDYCALQFMDASTGWMLANRGSGGLGNRILRTDDGGASWSVVNLAPQAHLADLVFVDTQRGWAVGSEHDPSNWLTSQPTVVVTQDGGQSWTAQTAPGPGVLRAVDFVDAAHGWAVGDGGMIVATGDGGATWTAQDSGTVEQLCDVDFLDSLRGWAVGKRGVILATSDGGTTWTAQTSHTTATLEAVHFSDATTGCAAGGSSVGLYTSDAGVTWSPASSSVDSQGAYVTSLAFADSVTGWAAAYEGKVFKTTDAGASWTLQRPSSGLGDGPFLNDIACLDAQRIWAVGPQGQMTDTQDGGATWSEFRFAADQATAQRLTVTSRLGASGNPGSTVRLTLDNFPQGYVSLLQGYPAYPASATVRSLGSYASSGGAKETKSLKVPTTAKPGYFYWFGVKNANGILFLEAPFQVSRLKASRGTISPGRSVKLTGIVPTQDHWGSKPGKAKRVALFKSTRSATRGYKFVKYVKANGYGAFNAGYQKPTRTTWYLIQYPGDKWYWTDVTTPAKVIVRK